MTYNVVVAFMVRSEIALLAVPTGLEVERQLSLALTQLVTMRAGNNEVAGLGMLIELRLTGKDALAAHTLEVIAG